jgi:5-methyltetrahydropteroyltriglutamate--homocysteine methyltransferase
MWNYDFFEGIDGIEPHTPEAGAAFKGVPGKRRAVKITGKLGIGEHPMLAHFRFLKERTRATAKMTIPAPDAVFSIGKDWRPFLATRAYAGREDFFADLAQIYRKIIRGFADAGCRYLQLDEVGASLLCDAEVRAGVTQRGEDPDRTVALIAETINAALADRPKDLVVSMHTCRGNFRSRWHGQGAYDPIAETMFGRAGVDAFFVEYDDARSGGFEPLRYVPKGKYVVLGLISSKTPVLESKDEIKRRVDEASRYVDLDHLCLSPQCGFASTEEGNDLTEDEQWRKLAHVREIADEIWRG